MTALPITPRDIRSRALSVVMDFIRAEDLESSDDFPVSIARIYASLLEGRHELPDLETFLRKAVRVRTTFFRLNTRLTKRVFLKDLLETLNDEVAPLLKDVTTPDPPGESPVGESFCKRIYVEDIDSFSRVNRIQPGSVGEDVPLGIREHEIKALLANILGERFVPYIPPTLYWGETELALRSC